MGNKVGQFNFVERKGFALIWINQSFLTMNLDSLKLWNGLYCITYRSLIHWLETVEYVNILLKLGVHIMDLNMFIHSSMLRFLYLFRSVQIKLFFLEIYCNLFREGLDESLNVDIFLFYIASSLRFMTHKMFYFTKIITLFWKKSWHV